MKKALVLALAFVVAITLAGCANSKSSNSDNDSDETPSLNKSELGHMYGNITAYHASALNSYNDYFEKKTNGSDAKETINSDIKSVSSIADTLRKNTTHKTDSKYLEEYANSTIKEMKTYINGGISENNMDTNASLSRKIRKRLNLPAPEALNEQLERSYELSQGEGNNGYSLKGKTYTTPSLEVTFDHIARTKGFDSNSQLIVAIFNVEDTSNKSQELASLDTEIEAKQSVGNTTNRLDLGVIDSDDDPANLSSLNNKLGSSELNAKQSTQIAIAWEPQGNSSQVTLVFYDDMHTEIGTLKENI